MEKLFNNLDITYKKLTKVLEEERDQQSKKWDEIEEKKKRVAQTAKKKKEAEEAALEEKRDQEFATKIKELNKTEEKRKRVAQKAKKNKGKKKGEKQGKKGPPTALRATSAQKEQLATNPPSLLRGKSSDSVPVNRVKLEEERLARLERRIFLKRLLRYYI